MSFKVQTNMKVLTTRVEELPTPNLVGVNAYVDSYARTTKKIQTYLLTNRDAIAIASNQLFCKERVFGMWYEEKIRIFVEPRIRYDYMADHHNYEEEDVSKELEGCMSISNGRKKYLVERRDLIYVDDALNGLQKYQGYDARVIQHEIDHLEGITIKCRHKEQN